jgi:imidazolonepropionase-like amidohydrolase
MRISEILLPLALSSLCLPLCSPLALGQTHAPSQLVRDVRVFDGERVVEHRSVLIQDGKIAQVGDAKWNVPGAEIIEGRGRTLLPGFIDAHVHITDNTEDSARQALRFGVTTQLDMFSGGERLKKIKKLESEDRPDLADARTAGAGATVPGGHPTQMGGPPTPTLTSPDEAQAFVDARIAEGSDYIKIIHDDGSNWTWTDKRVPMLDNATMRAVIEAAHKRGKLAVVHTLSEQQARDAISAGADGLVHLFVGDTVSTDFGQFAASHHVFITPTLLVLYWDCGKPEGAALLADPKLSPYLDDQSKKMLAIPKPDPSKNHYCKGTDDAIRQLVQAHVPLLAGTDSPAPGTAYGAALHGEMTVLVRSGLTPLHALTAATSAPAQSFRLNDRGFIRAGMRADLVLVEGDPTADILATRNIVTVWKKGVKVQR